MLGAGERGESQPGMSPARRDRAGRTKPTVEAKRSLDCQHFFSTAVFVASPEVNSIQVQTENPTQLNSGGADISLFSELTKG